MKDIFEVSGLLENINNLFNSNLYLKDIYIRGEITDLREAASSGHKYFQIKDEKSLLKSVFFKFLQKSSDIFNDGDFVLINGEIEVYQPRGDLTLRVRSMTKEGLGDIAVEIQALRKTLESEGLFDQSRKRFLPKFPKSISVVTSPNSSAWEDIKKTISDRYPLVHINLIATIMQGENCEDDVIRSINYANQTGTDDIILISRGGGSEEDLMPFNLEKIPRAIFSSNIPVITGIGHEDDFTTSDMVADVRGLTPTSAAQLAVPDIKQLKEYLKRMRIDMNRNLEFYIENKLPLLLNFNSSVSNSFEKNIINYFQAIDNHETNLIKNLTNNISNKISKFERIKNSIEIYNIKEMAKKGFSMIENTNMKIIKSVSDVELKEEIKILMSDGILNSIINKKIKE